MLEIKKLCRLTFLKKWRFFAVFIATVSISSCSNKETIEPDDPEPDKGILIRTHPTLGDVLTDGVGQVLYFFTHDADGNSACTGACIDSWPIYYNSEAIINSEIDTSDIGVLTREDGSVQTTYKGWPLYYYTNDESSGQANGDGVGGNWFVAKPDYSVMLIQNQLVGSDGTEYMADMTPGEGQTQYLVDAYGRTLYAFINDQYNTNNFTNPDFTNNVVWPIYESTIQSIPSNIKSDDIAEITVQGRIQLTYKGWPLYFFGQDEKRGETKGIDTPAVGIWPVLTLDSPNAPNP